MDMFKVDDVVFNKRTRNLGIVLGISPNRKFITIVFNKKELQMMMWGPKEDFSKVVILCA